MKNLFKNLMLVAVAAMAFTACQNDNNEVNEVVKKTVITGVATIDANDTRSGFVGKNEAGDAYVSEWDGGESIRLFYSGWSDYTEIDAEGNFELDYIGDFDPGATATVCSPGDVWSNVNEYVIPEPQTPRENSVDPMAHILKSDATEIINGTLSVKMKHAVAYGKVSFPELSLDGDAVSNVVLDIDGAEYTINTSATQNIWFACEPNGTVSNMTVTVNTNGGQALYKKIIENGNKNLSFDKGIVSTFNVKGLEQKPTEPVEADFNVTLTKVTSIVDNVIRFEGDNAEDYITIAFNPGLETIVAGHYTSVEQDWLNGGAWAWSSESALEVKNEFEGSSVEVNAVGGGTWYYDTNSNGVDVSVEDGIYTIVAHLNNAGAGNKSVDFTYVGTLEVVEPAEKFDSTYAYVYQNYGATDKEIMFVAEDGRGLRIDFYNVYENNCIVPGTYTFSGSGYMYPNWSYYYANVNGYYTSKLNSGQAVVSVEDGQYKIVFTNMALNGTVYVESFTFKGQIEGLGIPDPRVKLTTPELSYTNEDKVVTLSWNAIEGVEYYSVECDSDAIEDFTTTETSATITLPEYGAYNFSVAAKVAETNENYKSSDAASVKVVVKDPNAWADYEMTSVAVSGTYVTMTDANDNRVTFFMNSADRIGNGIKLGNYSYIYSETPGVGQFVVYMCTYDGMTKYSYQIGSGSMSVEEVNGEYKILITVDGIRFGYIGTETLGAPITGPVIIPAVETLSFVQAGGEKTVNLVLANLTEDVNVTSTNDHFTATVSGSVLTVVAPENTVEAVQEATITLSANGVSATVSVVQEAYDPNAVVEDGSEANPYTIKTAYTSGWEIHFDDASNGDSFQMDVNNTDMRVWISDHGADTWIKFSAVLYGSGANLYTHNGTVYYVGSYAGYSYIKLSRDSSTSTYTCDFKMSVDGGNTYTYYRYVGTISGQQ